MVAFLQPTHLTQPEMLSGLQELHEDLVKWKPHIVSIPRPLDEQPLIEARLDQHMHILHSLKMELSGNVDPNASQAYPSIQFLEVLLASWLLTSQHRLETNHQAHSHCMCAIILTSRDAQTH